MLFAVVVHCVFMTRDRHRHVDRLDHQLPVLDHKGHVREVVIRVREVPGLQLHVIAARVRPADGIVPAEREVFIRVQIRVLTLDLDARHVVAAHHVLFAVVVHFVAVLRDRHRHLDRLHFQLAVHIRDLIARCDIVTFGIHDLCRARYVVAPAHHCLAARHRYGFNLVSGCQRRVSIAVLRQSRAVVHLLSRISRDRHSFRINSQYTSISTCYHIVPCSILCFV